MNLKLVSVSLEGFRSFYESTTIKFPSTGLFLIEGPSGSGKSSIMLSIAWVLDFAPPGFTNQELASWASERTQVDLHLTVDDKDLLVGKGVENYLQYDGTKIKGAKAVKEKLAQILGVSSETLAVLCYRPQGETSMFLGMSDSEKKTFLSTILGLDKLEEQASAAAKLAKEYQNKVLAYTETLNAMEVSRKRLEETVPFAPPPFAFSDKIAELESKAIQSVSYPKQKMLDEGKQILEGLLKASKNLNESYQNALQAYNLAVTAANNARDGVDRAKVRKRSLEADLAKFKDCTCPTCNQYWSPHEGVVLNLEVEIEKCAEICSAKPIEIPQKPVPPAIDPRIAQLQEVIRTMEIESAQVQNATVAELTRLKGLEAVSKTQQKAFDEAYARWKATVAKSDVEIEDKKAMIAESASQALKELDFSAMIGREGFLGVIFEEILNEIETLTNDALRKISNVSHVAIKLSTVKQTTKALENTITCTVNVGGQPAKIKTGLSGGQQTSLDRAVDRALRQVLSRRTGLKVSFLMEDETFDGQGVVDKESSLELLKEEAEGTLIMVIDHNSEFKEAFTSGAKVVNEGGKSKVELK